MKKFFAIIVAVMTTCCLMVSPAFAYDSYTPCTPATNFEIPDDLLGHEVPSPFPYDEDWEMLFGSEKPLPNAPAFADITNTSELKDWEHGVLAPYYPYYVSDIGGLIPIPRYVEGPEPGNYEFHFYDIDIDEEAWLAQSEKPAVPTVVTDTEAEDGEHLIEAIAPDEQQAISAVANRVAEVDPDGKTQFGPWESGEILPVIEEKVVVDEQAWTEEIQHEAKTVTVEVIDSPAWTERIEHEGTDPVIETVSDGWAKCDKDGQEDYVFTGDQLIIHDGQSGYWFWSANEVPDWKDICANSGINKADQVKEAQVGYGDFKYGNKVFTITANLIHANGGISWVAWEHLRQVVVEPGTPGWIETIDHEAVTHQETAIIEPAWIEYVNHPEVNHVEQVVVVPGYGWSSITYRLPEVPDVPVVPDAPDNPDPVTPDPDPSPTVTPVEEPEVVVDNPEVYVEQSQTPALPKTADENDAVVILLAAVAVGAVAVLAYNARRYSKEK